MTPKDMWTAAMLRVEPSTAKPTVHNSALFVLWCVGDGLCTTFADFEENFPVGVAYIRHLTRLVEEGFLIQRGDCYTVTDFGWFALRGFQCRGEQHAAAHTEFSTTNKAPTPPAYGEG